VDLVDTPSEDEERCIRIFIPGCLVAGRMRRSQAGEAQHATPAVPRQTPQYRIVLVSHNNTCRRQMIPILKRTLPGPLRLQPPCLLIPAPSATSTPGEAKQPRRKPRAHGSPTLRHLPHRLSGKPGRSSRLSVKTPKTSTSGARLWPRPAPLFESRRLPEHHHLFSVPFRKPSLYRLGEYDSLQPAIDWFMGSFTRESWR